jgi:vacuolar-type H+-ATPase subunit B/Vma2
VLASYDEGPVSLNIRDVIENTHHELPYEKRTMAHAQRRLRMEIIRRYAEHERTHPDVVHQLAHEVGLVQEYDKEHAMHDSDTTTEPTAYVLAIGDIFTDAFIKLKDEEARIITDDEGVEWLGVKFGQKMPYDEVDVIFDQFIKNQERNLKLNLIV